MSQFKKGQSGNPGGRPKGTPNKTTTDLRAAVTSFLNANWSRVQKEFDQLEAKDKLQFIDKMLAYSLPKLQAVQMDLSTDLQTLSDEQLDNLFNRVVSVQ